MKTGELAISPEGENLKLALKFCATGTFQNLISAGMNVNQSTVSRTPDEVTHMILQHSLIRWPDLDTQKSQSDIFFQKRKMPHVIGCVDGTHIPLRNRPTAHSDVYSNVDVEKVAELADELHNVEVSHRRDGIALSFQ